MVSAKQIPFLMPSIKSQEAHFNNNAQWQTKGRLDQIPETPQKTSFEILK